MQSYHTNLLSPTHHFLINATSFHYFKYAAVIDFITIIRHCVQKLCLLSLRRFLIVLDKTLLLQTNQAPQTQESGIEITTNSITMASKDLHKLLLHKHLGLRKELVLIP